MDKIKFRVSSFGFRVACPIMILMSAFSCNTKPDVTKEVKTIDSLHTEIEKVLVDCKGLDTAWVDPMTQKAALNIKMIKKVYDPDSISMSEAQMVTYYKGFRKVGRKFSGDRLVFIREFQKSLKQLDNLKTDAQNGALKGDDLQKFLNEEKLVTTDLIYKYKDFKSSTQAVLKNFDSLTPLIEKIIEVYSIKYESEESKKKRKSGKTVF